MILSHDVFGLVPLAVASPEAALSTAVQPAVPGRRDQHIDQLPLGKGQQGGVGQGRVGHQSPHDSPSSQAQGVPHRASTGATARGGGTWVERGREGEEGRRRKDEGG